MVCGIYALTHNATGKKYVGQSINIERRLYIHSLGKARYPIGRAIKKYGFDAFSIEIIEECERGQLGEREQHWISRLDTLTPNGFNLTTGGDQPVFTEETIQKLRYAQRNRSPEHVANKTKAARNPETIKKISAAMKNRYVSEETREKLRIAFTGRVFSEETRRAMSKAAKRRIEPFVERMVAIHKGNPLSDDHKAKLSAALSNPSNETRKRLSEAATGRKHSEETLQNMRLARCTPEWRENCAKALRGKKQTPEQIAKRVAATRATKAAKKLLAGDS